MSKLAAEKIILTQEVAKRVLEQYGIVNFDFEPLTIGIANMTAKVVTKEESYILRVYAFQRKTDDQILFELNFQDYLRQNGIPIPHVIQNEEGKQLTTLQIGNRRWQIVLFKFVKGASKTRNHTPHLIRELASLQARMHVLGKQLPFAAVADVRRWDVLQDYYACHLTDTFCYDENIQNFIAKAQSFHYTFEQQLPYSYNHLDLDLDGNVIVDGGHIQGVIDFDDLSYSPSVVCLGYSLWNVLHDAGIARMKQYLYNYDQIRPLSSHERYVLPRILQFRNYEIGALRLFRTSDPSVVKRPLEIETEILTMKF